MALGIYLPDGRAHVHVFRQPVASPAVHVTGVFFEGNPFKKT